MRWVGTGGSEKGYSGTQKRKVGECLAIWAAAGKCTKPFYEHGSEYSLEYEHANIK